MFVQHQGSSPVDEIQRQLFAVIGGEDPDELLQIVERQLEVVERELREVPERAQHNGPQFLAQAGEAMQSLLAQLETYRSWLQQLHQAASAHDHNAVVESYEQGQTVVPALTAAMNAYARAYASVGEYSQPWTNTLDRLAESIMAGHESEEQWDQFLKNFLEGFRKKAEDVRPLMLPGKVLCLEAYQQILSTLEALANSESLEGGELQPHFQRLDQSLARAQQLETLISQGAEGPTPIPSTNVLLSVVEKGLAGQLEMATVRAIYNEYSDILFQVWENFEKSVARPTESALVRDEIPRTLERGDAHDAVVEELGKALGGSADPGTLQPLLQRLIDTARQLGESHEVYATAAQHQSHVVCPGCSRPNPPENRRCEACGAVLPTPTAGVASASSTFNVLSGPTLEETQELPMTENVAKLFQACDDVHDGKITAAEFEAILGETAMGLKEFQRELGEIAEETADETGMNEETLQVWREQHLPYMQEVGAAFEEGIKQVEQGLLEMAAYVKDPQRDFLVNGVRMVWEGLGVVHRSRLAIEAHLKMLEDILAQAPEAEAASPG